MAIWDQISGLLEKGLGFAGDVAKANTAAAQLEQARLQALAGRATLSGGSETGGGGGLGGMKMDPIMIGALLLVLFLMSKK